MSIFRNPHINPLDILFSNKDSLVNLCKTLPTQITQNVPSSRQHCTETDGPEESDTVVMGDTVGACGDWKQSQVVCLEPVPSALYWGTSTLQSYCKCTDYGTRYCENTVSLQQTRAVIGGRHLPSCNHISTQRYTIITITEPDIVLINRTIRTTHLTSGLYR